MTRGGSTRLGYRLGVILMILELAHVPLPFPEHRVIPCLDRPCAPRAARTSEGGDPADAPKIEWHWFASTPGTVDDNDEIEVAAAVVDDEPNPDDDSVRCPHLVTPHRARMHHFVRGHSSKKGLGKISEGRSTFLGLADGVAKGLHPATNDLAHRPRAAMLQRWLC